MNFKFLEYRKEKPKNETKKGFTPIRGAIIDIENIDSQTKKIIKSIKRNGINVDYYAKEKVYNKANMKNSGEKTYVISECNDKNKYSEGYSNCTGVIVVGRNKEGKEISFMSHQDPTEFLFTAKDNFKKDLLERIDEILKEIEKDTIDVIVFGGRIRFFPGTKYKDSENEKEYGDSINLINNTIKEKLRIEPTVITGPSINSVIEFSRPTNVYFDTLNRRLYLVRSNQENSKVNEEYLPSQLEGKNKEW